MKKIKIIFALLVIILFGGSPMAYAQQKSADEVKQMVESKNFIFKAEVANPARGGSQQLSSGYDVSVTNSNVICYLPFYGRAQTIPIGAADGGIKFTSTSFEYKTVNDGKVWQVTIKPNDVSHVQQLYLSIYDDGTATLDVMNIHRDNISFKGYVK